MPFLLGTLFGTGWRSEEPLIQPDRFLKASGLLGFVSFAGLSRGVMHTLPNDERAVEVGFTGRTYVCRDSAVGTPISGNCQIGERCFWLNGGGWIELYSHGGPSG